jgi:integrase
MAMCGWEREAKQAQPHEQPTATAADIADAVRLAANDVVVQALLMLQWCFAGRQGDVLQAMRNAVKLDEETGRIEMAFRFGKRTARGGDPYTLTSQVPAQWRAQLAAYLRSRPRDARLFDTVAERMLGARATAALRVANSKLNARSIRRGALQAMGARGVPLEQIQQFAGHARQQTTLRYLGWAARWAAGQNALADAAQALELTFEDSSPSRSRSTTEEEHDRGGPGGRAAGLISA